MKKIHWLIPFRDNAQDFLYFTDIASIRLRAGVVESNIKKTSWQFSANDLIIENPSIIVVGKITSSQIDIRSKNWLGQLDFYKNRGAKIVLDYTDNHLNIKSPMTEFYSQCIPLIDAAVSSSRYLKFELKKIFNGPIHLIPDAIEVKVAKPTVKLNDSLSILWFGHSSNIKYLINFIPKFKLFNQKIILYILTNQ